MTVTIRLSIPSNDIKFSSLRQFTSELIFLLFLLKRLKYLKSIFKKAIAIVISKFKAISYHFPNFKLLESF